MTEIVVDVIALAIYGLIVLTIATRRSRKRLDQVSHRDARPKPRRPEAAFDAAGPDG